MATIHGTDGADRANNRGLQGTWEDDTIYGYGGYDILYGDGGDDWLDGGSGQDEMHGERGDDTYIVDDAGDLVVEKSTKTKATWATP